MLAEPLRIESHLDGDKKGWMILRDRDSSYEIRAKASGPKYIAFFWRGRTTAHMLEDFAFKVAGSEKPVVVTALASTESVQLEGVRDGAELESRLKRSNLDQNDIKFMRFEFEAASPSEASESGIVIWSRVDLFGVPRGDDSAPDDMGIALPTKLIPKLIDNIALFITRTNRTPVNVRVARSSVTCLRQQIS